MDQFLTLEALRTFAGSVAAVVALVQIVKQVVPSSWEGTDTIKRVLALVAGVGLQVFFAWQQPAGSGAYILAVANGIGVALAAMKLYEVTPNMPAALGGKSLVVLILIPFLSMGAGCEKTTNNTTTNVSITIEGVQCFTILIPGIGAVPAANVIDNRDGTVTHGGTTYTVNTSCQANPVTNPPPAA